MPETATMSAIAAVARPQPETERQPASLRHLSSSSSSSSTNTSAGPSSSRTAGSSSSASGSSTSKSNKAARPMPLRTSSILRVPLRDQQPLHIPIPPTLQDSPLLQSPHSIFRRQYSGAHTPGDEEERWLRDTVPINSPSNYAFESGGSFSPSTGSRSAFPQSPPVQTPIQHHHHHERRESISQVQQLMGFSSRVGLGLADSQPQQPLASSSSSSSHSLRSGPQQPTQNHPSTSQTNASFPGPSLTSSSPSPSCHAPSHSSRSATPQQGLAIPS